MGLLKTSLLTELKNHCPALLILCFLTSTTAVLFALLPIPFKFLLDNVIGSELLDRSTFLGSALVLFPDKMTLGIFVAMVYFALNTAMYLSEFTQSAYMVKLSNRIVCSFAGKVFAALEKFNIGFLNQQDSGDFLYRINYDVIALGSLIESGLVPILSSVVSLSIIIGIMFSIDFMMTILALLTLPFLSWILYLLNRRFTRAVTVSEKRFSNLYAYLQQIIGQLKVVQAYTREKQELARFNHKTVLTLSADLAVARLNFLLTLSVGLVLTFFYTLIVVFGIQQALNGAITAGLLILFLFYFDNLTSPVITILNSMSDIKQAQVKLKRLSVFFDPGNYTADKGKLDRVESHSVKFANVTLLDKNEKPILSNISCVFKENEFNVIIGASGSGKSALVSLIARLNCHPAKGKIYLGQNEVSRYSLEALRRNIAYVPQETELFNDSIGSLIAWGKPGASTEEINQAAKQACVHSFITVRPDGYAAKVGEEGILLSGGQRQRLSLARAYLKDAPIMVLDEILSSQDKKNRRQIMANLRLLGKAKTVIIVTHSLVDLKHTDYVVCLDKGKISASGYYGDLCRQKKIP